MFSFLYWLRSTYFRLIVYTSILLLPPTRVRRTCRVNNFCIVHTTCFKHIDFFPEGIILSFLTNLPFILFPLYRPTFGWNELRSRRKRERRDVWNCEKIVSAFAARFRRRRSHAMGTPETRYFSTRSVRVFYIRTRRGITLLLRYNVLEGAFSLAHPEIPSYTPTTAATLRGDQLFG